MCLLDEAVSKGNTAFDAHADVTQRHGFQVKLAGLTKKANSPCYEYYIYWTISEALWEKFNVCY